MNPTAPYGAALLRIALAVVFLAHSAYLKLIVFSLPGTAGYFTSVGLPALLAYVVVAVEIAGGLALLGGIRVREWSLALAAVALGAAWVHRDFGWLFTNEGGGYEFPLFLAAAAIVQALLGPGALTLRGRAGTRQPAAT
ncbi:MAG: DoxX family protein [Pseudomonadota bacterium]